MINKTKCLNCESEFNKNIFLFDFCPVCKGINLKNIETKEDF